METKQELLKACRNWLEERNHGIQHALNAVAESLGQEEKSSAGDKHNTGRAMLQLEREKLGEQQEKLKGLDQQLKRIDLKATHKLVALGSIVRTDKAAFFISIPAGKLVVMQQEIFAIGTMAPIAKLLLGKPQGHIINWNGAEQKVIEIF